MTIDGPNKEKNDWASGMQISLAADMLAGKTLPGLENDCKSDWKTTDWASGMQDMLENKLEDYLKSYSAVVVFSTQETDRPRSFPKTTACSFLHEGKTTT